MKKLRFLVAFALVFLLGLSGCDDNVEPPPTGTLTVSFLDVGQADCTIIQTGTSNMIIDAGTNAGASGLVTTIKKMGISRFDFAIATHPHEDHIGGMDAVVNNFDIGTIIMPKAAADTKTFEDLLMAVKNKGLQITSYSNGSRVAFGDAEFMTVAPNSQTYDDTNNYSLVIKMTFGETSFLFTGDAESVSEKEMLAKGYDLRSDVLKVGHHGSTSSSTAAFLDAVSPADAVIFAGEGNDYGHPHQETLDKLASRGIRVYRTDLNGTVTFTSDGSKLTVKTER